MSSIHEEVKDFLNKFLEAFGNKEKSHLTSFYESHFKRLSDTHYKNKPWPKFNKIEKILNKKKELENFVPIFKLLYKELRFRHIYTRHSINVSESIRILSFENYKNLFSAILTEKKVSFEIPNQWIWDMVDEFCYQFQEYHTKRVNEKKEEDGPITFLENKKTNEWSIIEVLRVLEKNIEMSCIEETQKNNMPIKNRVQYALGLLSQIGLLMVNCSQGDYYNALKAIRYINFGKSGIFTQIFSSNVKLYYYTGLAVFMRQRYVQCIRIISSFLLHTFKYKKEQTTYQYSSLEKKIEKCYGLLALSLNLCPYKVDDSLYTLLKEKFGDKLKRLMSGDIEAYGEVFYRSTPKFFLPGIAEVQKEMFIQNIKNNTKFIKSFGPCMKSFKEIKLDRIKDFVPDMEGTPLSNFLSLKHKGFQKISEKDHSILEGRNQIFLESEFYIDDDVVVFAPPKYKNDVEILIRKILRASNDN